MPVLAFVKDSGKQPIKLCNKASGANRIAVNLHTRRGLCRSRLVRQRQTRRLSRERLLCDQPLHVPGRYREADVVDAVRDLPKRLVMIILFF